MMLSEVEQSTPAYCTVVANAPSSGIWAGVFRVKDARPRAAAEKGNDRQGTRLGQWGGLVMST
jgi:hypothetical protein